MDRRNFFHSFVRTNAVRSDAQPDSERPQLTTGLEAYTTPLTLDDALHLLRRISFAPTLSAATALVGKTAAEAADAVLGTGNEAEPTSPGSWIDVAQEDPNNVDILTRNGIQSTWETNFATLQRWWVDLMRSESGVLREKLTLFWSGHFTSEFTYDQGSIPPQVLYRQNKLFRKMRLGDFKAFLEEVSLDPAMLAYLGGVLNIKGKPNENYAREMMELFSCGIGQYTEGDVKEAARVLTGWKAALYSDAPAKNGIFNSYFEPKDHDIGGKQYLEHTISSRTDANNTEFQVRNEEIRGMLGILFDYRTDAIAAFLSRKIYRFFVYSNGAATDAGVLADMVSLFKQNNFQIRPLIKALLSSAHFYDPANRGVQIKTPAEFVVGMARMFSVLLPTTAAASLDTTKATMSTMEQVLMDPPNVAGWPGYRNWISTKTYPQRLKFAKDLIAAMKDSEAQSFVQQFPNASDVHKLIDAVTQFVFPVEVSQQRKDHYVAVLLSGGQDYEWPSIMSNTATCGVRVRNLLTTMAKAPDFHLC